MFVNKYVSDIFSFYVVFTLVSLTTTLVDRSKFLSTALVTDAETASLFRFEPYTLMLYYFYVISSLSHSLLSHYRHEERTKENRDTNRVQV